MLRLDIIRSKRYNIINIMNEKGVSMKRISEAELKVMKVIWEKKEVTSNEIIAELHTEKWNNNTIRTLINRLQEKKAVGIIKKEGRKYTYNAILDEKKYKNAIFKKILNDLYHNSIWEFIEQCYENKLLFKDDMKILYERINDILLEKK